MGRTFVTFEDAARLLKCSKRTVHNYVKKGLLRREYSEGTVVLCQEDIEQLADEFGSQLPALNNRTLLEILGRLKSMEVQLAVFKKMHGIEEHPPLRPDPEEALKLVGNAQWYLEKKVFTSPELDLWVSLFQRMDELTFDLIRRAGARNDFWQDFFNLCLHLMDFTSDPSKCKGSRIWVRHHLELNECRKSLRSLVLMWVELGHGKATDALRRHLGGGKDDLVRRLTGAVGKS